MTRRTSRSPRSRPSTVLALLAALALLLAACGDDDTDAADDGPPPLQDDGNGDDDGDTVAQLRERGVVRVGIANEVPYGYEDEDGNVTGAAPEVAREVLAALGIDDIEATVVDFGALIAGLQAGQFDMITAGMFINEERAEQIHFSDPDYCVSQAFAVEEGNPSDITDFESVAESDAVLAVLSGAVEEEYAQMADVPDGQLELFTSVDAQYDALVAGRVDVVAGTSLTVQTQVDARDGLEATEPFFPTDEDGEEIVGCGGHGFADEDFRDAFNEVLNEFREDGTTMEIITSYEDFTEGDVELANTLTLEDFLG
jgi:polar amino acid transport system substrate-binding protein